MIVSPYATKESIDCNLLSKMFYETTFTLSLQYNKIIGFLKNRGNGQGIRVQ